jgi:hypothetical protein
MPTFDASVATTSASAPEPEETYEFRLFASSTKPKSETAFTHPAISSAPQKITVRSPTPLSELGDGAFLGPGRPLGYYLTIHEGEELRNERKRRIKAVAVEGADLTRFGFGGCEWVSYSVNTVVGLGG